MACPHVSALLLLLYFPRFLLVCLPLSICVCYSISGKLPLAGNASSSCHDVSVDSWFLQGFERTLSYHRHYHLFFYYKFCPREPVPIAFITGPSGIMCPPSSEDFLTVWHHEYPRLVSAFPIPVSSLRQWRPLLDKGARCGLLLRGRSCLPFQYTGVPTCTHTGSYIYIHLSVCRMSIIFKSSVYLF